MATPVPATDPPGNRFRRLRPVWRPAIAVPLAAGLAVGVTVAVLPSGQPARTGHQPVLSVQLLADRVQRGWMTADGTLNYDAGIIGNPIFPYSKLGSLPRDPAKLNAYFVSQDPAKTDNKSVVDFSQIGSMLFGMVLPQPLEAEMFHALALIPMVQVKDHVKDIAGRAGVAFVLPQTGQSDKQEIILDASDYHLLAQGNWGVDSRRPSPDMETAIRRSTSSPNWAAPSRPPHRRARPSSPPSRSTSSGRT